MNDDRRKLLVGLLAVMFVLVVGDQLWTHVVTDPREALERRGASLRKQILKAKTDVRLAKKAKQKLKIWQQRSLPKDIQTARTLYQGWLYELMEKVELGQRYVDSDSPITRPGFEVLPFTLRGTGTINQLTKLLFQFYRSPHLHRIRTLAITPISADGQLDLSMAIDALIVEGAQRTDRLAKGESDVLASDDLRDYRVIVQRNLFRQSPQIELAEHTVLTAIVEVDGVPEAWFTSQADDKLYKLYVGDSLQLDWFEAVIEEISGRDVVISADGERWLLTIDDRLSDAVALPPEF